MNEEPARTTESIAAEWAWGRHNRIDGVVCRQTMYHDHESTRSLWKAQHFLHPLSESSISLAAFASLATLHHTRLTTLQIAVRHKARP